MGHNRLISRGIMMNSELSFMNENLYDSSVSVSFILILLYL